MVNLPPNPPKLPRMLFKMLLGAIVVCFAFLAGYGLGIGQTPDDGSFAAGYQAAREKLAESGLIPEQPTMTFLMGTVAEVGTDYIAMNTIQTVLNPLDEPAPLIRRVLVDSGTRLQRQDPKTGTRTGITLEEVGVGDSISVVAAEDITYADTFTATEVTVTAPPQAEAAPAEE